MFSRRSVFGLIAAASTARASQPTGANGETRSIPLAVSPVAFGAQSVLNLLPGPLADTVRARRCATDIAPFVNRAIARIDAGGNGGTLYFPAGTYPISTLDVVQTRASEAGITLIGAGRGQTILVPVAPGRVLINATGRNNLSLLDLEIFSGDHVSICGLLLARHAAHPECSRNRINNIRIHGSYSTGAAVAIAAESNGWTGCLLENSHVLTEHSCFVTANDPAAASLGEYASGIVTGSNTDNVMIDCEFYAPFDHARPVRFIGSAGYTMLACSVIAGSASGTRLATYTPLQSIFNGPVTWHAPHLEVFGHDTVVHNLEGSGTAYYRGINSYSGNYQVADGALLMARASGIAGRAIVQNSTWTVPLVSQGVSNVGIRVYALTDCDLSIRVGNDATGKGIGNIEIAGFSANSHVVAGSVRVTQVVTSAACL